MFLERPRESFVEIAHQRFGEVRQWWLKANLDLTIRMLAFDAVPLDLPCSSTFGGFRKQHFVKLLDHAV